MKTCSKWMKIKKKSPNRSPYPDNSKERSIWERGYRAACNAIQETITSIKVQGMYDILKILLYILKTKYHSSDEDLSQLSKDIVEYAGYVRDGRVTLEMIENELRNVYNVEF